jgi:hypothetical protein
MNYSRTTLAVSNKVNACYSIIPADKEHFNIITNIFVLSNIFLFVPHRRSKRLIMQREVYKNDSSRADTILQQMPRTRIRGLIHQLPIRLPGVVLN